MVTEYRHESDNQNNILLYYNTMYYNIIIWRFRYFYVYYIIQNQQKHISPNKSVAGEFRENVAGSSQFASKDGFSQVYPPRWSYISWADPVGGGGQGVRTPFWAHDVDFLTLGPKLDPFLCL